MKMDLPEGPLDNLTIGEKVNGGELTITNEEMQSFFDPCVDQIIDLIQSQIQNVERLRNRVKNIFLVGGFGESEYLQEQLEFSMRLRKIKLWRPDTSWTAVVRGAAIFGIEKLDHKSLTIMKTCERNYGLILNYGVAQHIGGGGNRGHYTDLVTNRIVAEGQLTWMIKKGDLLLSDTQKEVEEGFSLSFRETDNKVFTLPIYEYPDDDRPDRYEIAHDELTQAEVLTCDFSTFSLDDFDRFENPRNGKIYYTAHCICKAVLTNTMLTFSVIWNDIKICSVELLKDEKVPVAGRLGRSGSRISSPPSPASR